MLGGRLGQGVCRRGSEGEVSEEEEKEPSTAKVQGEACTPLLAPIYSIESLDLREAPKDTACINQASVVVRQAHDFLHGSYKNTMLRYNTQKKQQQEFVARKVTTALLRRHSPPRHSFHVITNTLHGPSRMVQPI